MDVGEPPGGPRGRGRAQGVGRAPILVAGGWPPSGTSCAQYFLYILEIISVKFQDFFITEYSLLFHHRIPAAGILPLHVNLVK